MKTKGAAIELETVVMKEAPVGSIEGDIVLSLLGRERCKDLNVVVAKQNVWRLTSTNLLETDLKLQLLGPHRLERH